MKIAPSITGIVNHEGRLLPNNKERLVEWLRTLRGKAVEIIIRERIKLRSSNENRYYWGVVVPLIQEWTGYETKEATHKEIGRKFWGKLVHVKDLDGKVREEIVPKSTTEMSTIEFEKKMQEVRDWADSNGVHIPIPNEVDFGD